MEETRAFEGVSVTLFQTISVTFLGAFLLLGRPNAWKYVNFFFMQDHTTIRIFPLLFLKEV